MIGVTQDEPRPGKRSTAAGKTAEDARERIRGELELFAITAPGLEPLAAAELKDLGIESRVEPGGVQWSGGHNDLYVANLHLRTAARVLATVGRFRARSFIELERHLGRLDWSPFIGSGTQVRLRVTSRKSRLYHERAIAERVLRQLDRPVADLGVREPAEEEEADRNGEEQLIVIRFHRDECVIRVDSSGTLLHRRGYRQALARAPLRENLAAAMLLAIGWRGDRPLLDPMCGSGTIPIEAALLSRDIPPGLASAGRRPRSYAFERWPTFRPDLWKEVVLGARSGIRESAGVAIVGTDRDAGAIEAARTNAIRAGVADDIRFDVRALSGSEAPSERQGVLVTNPPYGQRIGESGALRNLYAAIGRLTRERLPGWTFAMLSADRNLERQTGLPLRELFRTRNGGIPVRLVTGTAEVGDRTVR